MNSLDRFFQHLLYDFHVCNLIKEFNGPKPTWQFQLDDENDELDSYTIHLKSQVICLRFVSGWIFQVPIEEMREWVEARTSSKWSGYSEIKLNYKLMKDIVCSFETCYYCGLQRNCLTSQHCSECPLKRICDGCYPEFAKDMRLPECMSTDDYDFF